MRISPSDTTAVPRLDRPAIPAGAWRLVEGVASHASRGAHTGSGREPVALSSRELAHGNA
jgi:hypothetical protein